MTLILSGTDGLSDVDGSAATPAIRGTDANTGIFFPAADTVGVSTGGSERVRVNSSGNVGIGTSSSSQKLQIANGNIYISTTNWLMWDPNGHFGIQSDASTRLSFYCASGTERMRIDSSGNVGIGTSSPVTALSVSGAFSFTAVASTPAVGSSFFAPAANTLAFGTASTERMRIDSSGNVGIGTASPSYKFHVVGNDLLLTTSSGNTVFGTTTTATGVTVSGGFQALQAQSLRVGTFGGSGAYSMEFVSQNNVRVSMEPAGNFFPQVDNSITIGKSGQRWSAVWAANGTIQTSDINAKIDVVDSPLGLSFIASLRPVAYKYKVGRNQVIDNPEDTDNPTIIPIAGKRQHFGLIAQEVKAALPNGIDFGGWALTDFEDQNSEQGLRYDQFIAPIIKAIQEQQALIQQLQADVATLKGQK